MNYLKMTVAALTFAATLPVLAETCATKQKAIENEISIAQSHNNTHKVARLETALTQLKKNCSPASLQAEHQRKVLAAEQKVQRREAALNTAKTNGKSDKKIAQLQAKLDSARAHLEQLQKAQ